MARSARSRSARRARTGGSPRISASSSSTRSCSRISRGRSTSGCSNISPPSTTMRRAAPIVKMIRKAWRFALYFSYPHAMTMSLRQRLRRRRLFRRPRCSRRCRSCSAWPPPCVLFALLLRYLGYRWWVTHLMDLWSFSLQFPARPAARRRSAARPLRPGDRGACQAKPGRRAHPGRPQHRRRADPRHRRALPGDRSAIHRAQRQDGGADARLDRAQARHASGGDGLSRPRPDADRRPAPRMGRRPVPDRPHQFLQEQPGRRHGADAARQGRPRSGCRSR